jgi:hypothetical protein
MSGERDFERFEDFWPHYVREHRRAGTRALHFAGTTFGLLCLAAAAVRRDARWLAGGLAGSYGLAWIGHFFVERNRPATFRHPLWSFYGDFRMYGLAWRRRMAAELARVGLAPAGESEEARPSV